MGNPYSRGRAGRICVILLHACFSTRIAACGPAAAAEITRMPAIPSDRSPDRSLDRRLDQPLDRSRGERGKEDSLSVMGIRYQSHVRRCLSETCAECLSIGTRSSPSSSLVVAGRTNAERSRDEWIRDEREDRVIRYSPYICVHITKYIGKLCILKKMIQKRIFGILDLYPITKKIFVSI